MLKARPLTALAELGELIRQHGLEGVVEAPLTNSGYSGAMLSRMVRTDGVAFVLKRMSVERDWIMRATDDTACREAWFAGAPPSLPLAIRAPYIAAARDGNGYAVLSHDVTALLLPEGVIAEAALRTMIRCIAQLHAGAPPPDRTRLCGLRERVTLLTPNTAEIASAYGAPVAQDIIEGWRIFERRATPDAAKIIRSLAADPAPLLRGLGMLPQLFLHGDLKFDNIGVDAQERLWLIDWAMTLVAPAAVELGWFLAINSRRLPVSLDAVMEAYAAAAGMTPAVREQHDALTAVCGLLLRGWRKALDAEEDEPGELGWWCRRVEDAAPLLS